jgi:hypothetical protein
MKTAASIRYGGMLIDALECDYTSFKHLGLLCPICKRTVFLVKESTRLASQRKTKDGSKIDVKAADIPAYFAHHPEVDKNTVNDCELRSKQITVTERVYLEAKAHNQRQKILQAHLWRMIQTSPIGNDIEDDIEIVKILWRKSCVYHDKKADFMIQELINFYIKKTRTIFIGDVEEIVSHHIETLQVLFSKAINEYSTRNDLDSFQSASLQYYQNWTALDSLMHKKISLEVFDFLKQKKQVKMLERLLFSGFYRHLDLEVVTKRHDARSENAVYASMLVKEIRRFVNADEEDLEKAFGAIFCSTIELITVVSWAYQFELLEQRDVERNAERNVERNIAA